MGARIGASYREVMRKFGPPAGVLIAAGGGIVYQTMPTRGFTGLGQTGAADGHAAAGLIPCAWPFSPTSRRSGSTICAAPAACTLGIVLSGEGADAVVTDVVVAGYPEYLKGKQQYVRTERGVSLREQLRDRARTLRLPSADGGLSPGQRSCFDGRPRTGGGSAGAAQGGGARWRGRRWARWQALGAVPWWRWRRARCRRGMRGGGGRMRGSIDAPTTRLASAAPESTFEVQLTQMRGGGGGRGAGGGGGMGRWWRSRGGGGGRGGVRRRWRRRRWRRRSLRATRYGGALPPLGTATATAAAATISGLTATAIVDNQAVGFSRDCILTYSGIAFTLHDMRVIRIHVSE